jgi:cellulose synthase/poly-beta-1,6-N-acetylglucosamine synthase-like glycosyltransferase
MLILLSNLIFLSKQFSEFQNENVAIVQTPLGILDNPTKHYFASWIFLVYRYYLSIYMNAADHFNNAPFIGAMGIIRRSALENVEGWNGFYLTEDMELTYRLFKHGYISHFINHSYGNSALPVDLSNFKKQHYRWNFGNAQIIRDYLRLNISSTWRQKMSPLRWFIYFCCPFVYINIYFIPFALIAILIQGANLIGYPLIWTELISFTMVTVIIFELIGDVGMFAIMGKRENVGWKFRLKNLVSWWALTLTNSLSSFEVIFRQTRHFEITEKGQNVISGKRSPKYFELILSSLFLGSMRK